MRIFIDADGCPVVKQTVNTAHRYKIECVIVCDTAHEFNIPNVKIVMVDKGADSVDFKLVNMLSPTDIAVTQDYGLAAMCLSRGAYVINQNGTVYNDSNIFSMLETRAVSKKIRRAGGRLKGPRKRSEDDDKRFIAALTKLIEDHI